MRTFLSFPFILLLYWTPPSLNNPALDKWCKTLSMGMRSHPITCECDGLNPPPPRVSGSCALPVHNRLTLFQDRNALCQRVCVRASHSEATRSVCHPQSNTLKINSTHEQTHTHTQKNIWSLKQAVANCCLGVGAGWYLIYQLVQDVSALFNSTLPSRWRWRYVYVWISQWIYYNRPSGPVRQACDPGSGLAILIGHVSLCYWACHLLWDDGVTK